MDDDRFAKIAKYGEPNMNITREQAQWIKYKT